jgi:carbon storage regulator
MLVLSRKKGERITIGDAIIVTVLRSSGGRVTLGITAPDAVSVQRTELGKCEERRPLRLKI